MKKIFSLLTIFFVISSFNAFSQEDEKDKGAFEDRIKMVLPSLTTNQVQFQKLVMVTEQFNLM